MKRIRDLLQARRVFLSQDFALLYFDSMVQELRVCATVIDYFPTMGLANRLPLQGANSVFHNSTIPQYHNTTIPASSTLLAELYMKSSIPYLTFTLVSGTRIKVIVALYYQLPFPERIPEPKESSYLFLRRPGSDF